MKKQVIKRIFFILFALILSLRVFTLAQEKKDVTVEWIYSGGPNQAFALPQVNWLNDGTALVYDVRKPFKERTFEKLNPVTGRRQSILDMDEAVTSLRDLLGPGYNAAVIGYPLSFDESGQRAVYLFEGDVFVLEFEEAEFSRITNTEEEESAVNFSPDGKKIAFVRGNDLYVYDLEKSMEKALTTTGSETLLNGTLSWVYWEEIFARRDIGYWWSGDSEAIAFLETDESQVGIMQYKDFKPQYPRIVKQRYPKVGTANPVVRVGVVEIESGDITWAGLSVHSYEYICRVKWLPFSKKYSVQTMPRDQYELDLYFVDRYTGKPEPVMTETNEAWVNIHDDLYFLKDGKYFIWASERDGYEHLYRFTMDGKLVNQITEGEWAIRSSGGGPFWLRQAVSAIDEKNGWIYFTALKKSSIEKHLYRIRFDGTGMERLSKEDGTHGITFSPEGDYYFDNYSNITTPPSLKLYKADGEEIMTLAEPKTDYLEPYEIQYPELFTIPAKDGFPLPAHIVKPKNFDPNKKYPVIMHVYGGPSAPQVANAYNYPNFFNQVLMDEGYLCVEVDPRVSTAKSKKLENLIYKNAMSDVELSDLVDAVQWLKKQSYVDPDRIGIWGWSGGGCYTLLGMSRSKEFKAGIAVAAVMDWRYYDTKWGECAMKLPQDNPEGFERAALVNYAKDLHGRLMLVHGTYDDNVNPQNVWHYIDELIKANKMFDLMIYPMRKHGISDRPARIHLYNRMVEFWKKNL